MRRLRTYLLMLVVLLIVLCGVALTLSNPGVVTLDLVLWQTGELTLGVLLTLTLLFGVLVGTFINQFVVWKHKAERSKLQKQLDQSLKRMEHLK